MQQTKDLETTVAGIRADKVKEKTASDAAKKGELPAMLRMLSLRRKEKDFVLTCSCAGQAYV